MLIKVAFETTEALDGFIGKLQTFGSTETQIVFSTALEHRGVDVENVCLDDQDQLKLVIYKIFVF